MTSLYPYQQEGVRLIEKFDGRVLLADEQGLGKTLQVLWWLKIHPELRPAVIVCPASVKYVWEDQARDHCELRVTVCSGQKAPKKEMAHRKDIFIINYDILFHWANYLRTLHPQFVCFDEGHKLKGRESWRTRAARKLCSPIRRLNVCGVALRSTHGAPENGFCIDDEVEFIDRDGTTTYGFVTNIKSGIATIKTQTPHLCALSGTPLVNRPAELWPILNLIWPSVFPAFTPFAWEFCEPEYKYGWQYNGANNLPKLHRMLTRLGMIRRRKKDVLKDLPQKRVVVVPLDISNRKEYQQAESDLVTWLRQKNSDPKEKKTRKDKQKARMFYLKRLAAEGKLPAVYDWIDSFREESEDKLLLGCWHHSVIDAIHSNYPTESLTFTGKTSPKLRGATIATFRNDKRKWLLTGQIQAVGTGVDGIQQVSHTSAVVELPWDPGTLSQFCDRIHRIGQEKAVTIYILVARGTIEEKLCRIIQQKQDVLTRTLDGEEHVEQRKIDIFDQLEKELMKGNQA